VKEHGDRIELFFLPSYSPDLNPDEWVSIHGVRARHAGARRWLNF
jgi:transposase